MNRCGNCSVCCFVPELKIISKEQNTLCANYCGGCRIYDNRPIDCQTYRCIWITQENIDVKYRPDILGVVFEQPLGKRYWVGIELKEDALKQEDCIRLVRSMNNDGAYVMLKSTDGILQYSIPDGADLKSFLEEYNQG